MSVNFEYKRPLVVTLTIGCDDLEELGRVFRQLDTDIATGDLRIGSNTSSGGSNSGYHIEVVETPDMTGDRYRELLREWSEERREARRRGNG